MSEDGGSNEDEAAVDAAANGDSAEQGLAADDAGLDGKGPLACSPGFENVDGGCADVNECLKTQGLCGNDACRNREGGYACGDCATGYAPSGAGSCVDIDECKAGSHTCGAHADCQNAAGGFACSCRLSEGYTGDSTPCADLDECADPMLNNCGPSPIVCVNRSASAGRFMCACPSGYSGTGVGPSSCSDVNECMTTPGACDTDPVASCSNTIGSFTCACPTGFVGSGKSAQGCVPLLNGLALNTGTLVPVFDPLVTEYTVETGFFQRLVTITPIAQAGFGLVVDGANAYSGQAITRPLLAGAGQVQVVVSAGGASRTYTLRFTRGMPAGTYFKASNASENDQFGSCVALSADGSTLAVGANREDSSAMGTVYVFRRTGTFWTEEARLKANSESIYDLFGSSVALNADGSTLAVGDVYEDSSTTGVNSVPNDAAADSGAAYVFRRTTSGWTQQAYIKASNPGAGDSFGQSVALSADGSKLAVGAMYEASSTTGVNSTPNEAAGGAGAAYVFQFTGTTWIQEAYIKASVPAGYFGSSVALSSDAATLAIGAPGEPSSSSGVNPTPNYGAPYSGAAFVFSHYDTGWAQDAFIKASNPGEHDYFGTSVSLSAGGGVLAVGSYAEDSSSSGINSVPNENAESAGAVYVFRRNGSWAQDAYIKASNPRMGAIFGNKVALSGDGATLAVGSSGERSSTIGINSTPDDFAPGAGAAYVFQRNDASWTQLAYVKALFTRAQDSFGSAVSLTADGAMLAVGVVYEQSSTTGIDTIANNAASFAGAAYVYR
jgi:hypothetical protein